MIVVINKTALYGLTEVIKNKTPVKMRREDGSWGKVFTNTHMLVEAGADAKAFPFDRQWIFRGNETTFVATREEYERWLGR